MLSRVADNLYWMSRYLERAEHTTRVMGVHLNLMLEHDLQLEADQIKYKDVGQAPTTVVVQPASSN